MASDVRRNFQSQTTPVSTPTPRIDDAMHTLNEALDDLGKLRIRTDACKVDLNLSSAEAKACIDAFMSLISNMVVPDVFAIPLDIELLRVIPDIAKSPYVNIDPGMYLMYYNALYYGLHQIRGAGDPVAQGMYLKVLEAVPAWLDEPGLTDLDGHTAALISWTAITNHDYQLAWKFHCKACQYIKMRRIDQLDVIPAKSFDEEDKRDTWRYLYWQVLATDILFRLFYGKPTVVSGSARDEVSSMAFLFFLTSELLTHPQVRWTPKKIKAPSIFRQGNMQPSANQVLISVAWIRYTLLTAEIINVVDNASSTDHLEVEQKVNNFCVQLEDLMVEWNLETLMRTESTPTGIRYLIADHVMNIYAIIIGMQRLIRPTGPSSKPVKEIALRAARNVVQITLAFSVNPSFKEASQQGCIQYVRLNDLLPYTDGSQFHKFLSLLRCLFTVRTYSRMRRSE